MHFVRKKMYKTYVKARIKQQHFIKLLEIQIQKLINPQYKTLINRKLLTMQFSLHQLIFLLVSIPLSLAAAVSRHAHVSPHKAVSRPVSKTTTLGGTTTVLPPFTYTVKASTYTTPARTFTGSGKFAGVLATQPARVFTDFATTATLPATTLKFLPTTIAYRDDSYEKQKPANMDFRVWRNGGGARLVGFVH